MTWTTKMSALSAGGYNNCVAYDPTLQGHIIAGGDTFGFNESFDGGATWSMANLGLPNNTGGTGGVCGIAFDPVTGKSYAGMGIAPTIVTGAIVADPQQRRFTRWSAAAASVGGFFGGGNATWLPAGDTRPRATGRVLEVDNFGGTRYVYAQPWKNGIWRSTNDYASAVNIYSDTATIGQQLNGIVLDPTNKTRLLVGRWGYGDGKTGAAQIGNIRAAGAGAATYLSLSNAPPSVLEWCVIGTNVYAACGWDGVYRVSLTGGNWNTWTPMNLGLTLGTDGIAGQPIYCGLTGYNDGTHDVLFVCCANPPHIGSEYSSVWRNPQAEIATNAVSTWQNLVGVPANVNGSVIGSGEQWWLKAADAAFMLGGSVGDMENLTIDPFDTSRVHVVGRAGGWQTSNADAAAAAVEWRPCVNGQGGTTTWMLVADATRPNHFYTTNVDHVMVGTNNDFRPGSVFKNKPAGASNQGTWGDMGPDGKFYLGVGDRDTATINGEVFQYSGDPVSSASVSMGLGASTAAGNKPQGLAITGTGSAPIILAGVYNKGVMRRVAGVWTNPLSAALLDPVPSKTNHFPTAKDADGQAIYFGGPDTGIFRSLNQGATWPQAGGGANGLWWAKDPGGFVGLSLGCDPVTPGLLYGCFSTGIWRVAAANVAGTNGTTAAVRITPATGPLTALQGMAISQAGPSRGWVYACTAPTAGVDAQFWECQNPAAGSPTWTQQDDGFAFASAAYSLNWMAVDNQGGQVFLMPGGVFEVDSIPLQPGSTSSFPGAADVFVPPAPNSRLHIPGATPADQMKRMNDAIEATETAALVRTSPDVASPESFAALPEVMLNPAESLTGWAAVNSPGVSLITSRSQGSFAVRSTGRIKCGINDPVGKIWYDFPSAPDITNYATLSVDIRWDSSGPIPDAAPARYQVVVASGTALTGTQVIQNIPDAFEGQYFTMNVSLFGVPSVRSVGIRAWNFSTQGGANTNTGVLWAMDYVRLSAQSQFESALFQTPAVVVPPSYPPEFNVHSSYPTKTALDLRPSSALLQRHGGVRHIREWSVADDGSQDVGELLSEIIASLAPRSTLLLSPGGQYLSDGQVNIMGTDITIDGQGATIFTNRDRGNLGSIAAPNIVPDHMVYVTGDGITIRNLTLIGGRTLAINMVISSGVVPSPTPFHLANAGDEIMTDPTQVYYCGRDKDGLLKIQLGVIKDTNQVPGDCLVRMVDAVTGREMTRMYPVLTNTNQPLTISVDGAAWLGSQPRAFISKVSSTPNDISAGSGLKQLFNIMDYRGNHDSAAGFQIVTGTGITIEDCRVEGIQTDAVQCNSTSAEQLVIRRVQSICCSRQGMSVNKGRHVLIQDCVIRECGRSGIDFEPYQIDWSVWHVTVRGCTFVNVENYCIANGHTQQLWYFRVEDCVSYNVGIRFMGGGGHHGVFRNIRTLPGARGPTGFFFSGRNCVVDHIMADGNVDLRGMGVFTWDASVAVDADPEIAALGPHTYADGGNMASNITVVGPANNSAVKSTSSVAVTDIGTEDDTSSLQTDPYNGPINVTGEFTALAPGKFGDIFPQTFKGLGFSKIWSPGGFNQRDDPISNARSLGAGITKGNNLARVGVVLPTGAIGATVNFPAKALPALVSGNQPTASTGGTLAVGTYYIAIGAMDIYGGPRIAQTYNPVTLSGSQNAIRILHTSTNFEALGTMMIPGFTWFRAGPAPAFPGAYSARYAFKPTSRFYGWHRTATMEFRDYGTSLTFIPPADALLGTEVFGYPFTVPPTAGSFTLVDETGWEADTNYGVMVETSWPTVFSVTAKRQGGFDLSFATPAPAGAKFSWMLVRG